MFNFSSWISDQLMITGIRQPKSLRTKSKPDEVLAYSSQSIDQYVTSNRVFSQSGVNSNSFINRISGPVTLEWFHIESSMSIVLLIE